MDYSAGFKVGDRVRIMRRAWPGEGGWEPSWVPQMTESVGKVGVVEGCLTRSGLNVRTGEGEMGNWWYPNFVLEKVEKEVKIPKKELILHGKKIMVSETIWWKVHENQP